MTDFALLSAAQQTERLDTLAADALHHYGLADAKATRISYTNNAIYHIDAGTSHYALRVHRPNLKKHAWIQAELAWLRALHEQTSLRAPVPAAPLYTGQMAGVDVPVYCALFAWQTGDPIETLTEATAQAVGKFAAQLHTYSAQHTPDRQRPKLDWEGLFGQQSPYRPSAAGEALFTAQHRAVLNEATQHIHHMMQALGKTPQTFGMIHADLIIKNLLWDDELVVLDFDDCAYGYFLYDLAPLLLGIRTQPNAPALRDALWAGYNAIRPQPAHHTHYLDAFIAARHIASIRWIAGNISNPSIRDRAADIINARVALLHGFLQTGRL